MPDPEPDSGHDVPQVGEGLPGATLRVLARFTHGYSPSLHRQVRAAGSLEVWLDQQLDPRSITDDAAAAVDGWWESQSMGHSELWEAHLDGTLPGWITSQNYARWALARRITSHRHVHEVMSEFWEDHLHIPLTDDLVFPYRADYGRTVRAHSLGSFADLLKACTTHPAMSLSLDNTFSTKWAPNENLGRELLELHTVGAGNFTEDDVKAASRILTGYTVDIWKTWDHAYDPDLHWTGSVSALGFAHANTQPDGRPVVDAFLDHLARHPLTATRIARKLVQRFVADDPPAGLVERIARVYLDNDTRIAPVVRALATAPELRSAAGRGRTPISDAVATYRALDVQLERPRSDESCANALLWCTWALGQVPFNWPRPDGPPVDTASWSSTSRVLAAMDFHLATAAGWWPRAEVTFQSYASWMPGASTTFVELVDHLSLRLFGHRAADRVVRSCSEALGIDRTHTIDMTHALVVWRMPYLLGVLLDSPEHLLH